MIAIDRIVSPSRVAATGYHRPVNEMMGMVAPAFACDADLCGGWGGAKM